jgi:hypothetical protein
LKPSPDLGLLGQPLLFKTHDVVLAIDIDLLSGDANAAVALDPPRRGTGKTYEATTPSAVFLPPSMSWY